MKVYLNGKLLDKTEARISVLDHGLLYGDGVFEGIRAYNGRIFMLERHIDRLYASARAIALEIPISKERMAADIIRTCRANRIRNGYIRPIVTRGVGTLGLNPFVCRNPQVIIIASRIQLYPPDLYEEGLELVTVGTLRNLPEAINPRIKSLNYLNNILAKIEALNAGVMECIMLNAQGFVAEASGDNVFVVKGNRIVTPPSWCGALEGVTRGVVMELAAEMGYDVREEVLSRYDLYTAEEVFLTGTAAEIIGVVKIDRRAVGAGSPGPVTRSLMAAFRQLVRRSGTPIWSTGQTDAV
ncbi:MAG TPA: branched-chain-amino-acid transaminase [Kiritimatiellae bacterium]|nr:branched-chain-amino-acid transaminase [Kiritimatiellia bacterium]